MASRTRRQKKKKPPRWRSRICNCALYETSHKIRSKKAWRAHQLLLGKLLAGARDAEPKTHQLAHIGGNQSADSDLDIGSSIATNPYGGSEYQSLQDDEISRGSRRSGDSSGDPGTTDSSELEHLQQDRAPSCPTTTTGTNSIISGSDTTRSRAPYSATGIGGRGGLGEKYQGSAHPPDAFPDGMFGSTINTKSLSTTSASNESSNGMDSQSNASWWACGDQAEATFFEEVKNLIGDPDDWTGSEDESLFGDPFEVGLMKTGFIDEDVLEDTNTDLLDLEDAVDDLSFAEDMESTFLYDSQEEPWTEEELMSFLLYDIKRRHTVTREAHERYTNIIRHFSPLTPFCFPTTLKRMEGVTGIQHRQYDCCVNSCMAFTESDSNHCLICLSPRFDRTGKPVKTMDYISLIHQLRLQYSCASRSKKLMSYPIRCQNSYTTSGVITDIWNGRLLDRLREKGLFANTTDLSLSFHTDGVKLFKTRSAFHIWPLLLIINNLPPEERFKRENLLLLGLIPGPQQPKDIDSFLRPLVNELKALQEGVPRVYNGATKEYFVLHAYVCMIGADTKGREQLMGISTNSYSYCFYCKARGLHSGGSRGHVYCPFTRPPASPLLPNSQGPAAARRHNNDQFQNLDPANLDLRTDEEFRRDAWAAFASTPPQAVNGVSRLPIWCELESVVFPWSFVLDEMHLFWENVIILLFNHWRGRFFNRRDSKAHKFEKTGDSYNIDPSVWNCIGDGMEGSKGDFPTAWGDALRNITKHCHEFKVAEWRNFGLLIAPIVLNGEDLLPEECYEAFCDLIEAIDSATSDIPIADIDSTIRLPLIDFLHHYETVYYQLKWERLETCRSQIHLLAHVADFVEWCGPMNLYSQWSCERLCGSIAGGIRNRVQANRAASLSILRQQQMFHIPFLARKASALATQFISDDGEPDLFDSTASNEPDTECLGSYLEALIEVAVTDIRSGQNFRKRGPKPAAGLSDGPEAGELDNIYLPPVALYGPVKQKIKTYLRSLIFQFLQESGMKITRQSIPKVVTGYRTAEAHDGSLISSDDLRPGNATRSRSYAQYLWGSNRSNHKRMYYGRVLLFLSLKLEGPGSRYPEIFLALVQDFQCVEEGRLQRIVKVERQEIISARDVVGLVGVIKNGINNASYIVRQRTALIG